LGKGWYKENIKS